MPVTIQKPKIFIGSSSEARELALAIQHELRDIADSEPWSQGMFRIGSVPLDILNRALNGFDFAVFLFTPSDVTVIRGEKSLAVRDNVLFELGLFMGHLGPERSFFVTPVSAEELHLPSDLSGIIPAKYDAKKSDLQASVADACFEIRREVKRLGLIRHNSLRLFDGPSANLSATFHGVEGRKYPSKGPPSEKGRGSFTVEAEGVIRIQRTNVDGKYELQLRPKGPKLPSFLRSHNVPPRLIRVNCEAKAEGGDHTVRFVVKDEAADKWLADEKKSVKSGEWTKLESYLWVDSTKDFVFRIDDVDPTRVPSSLYIRNLTISEETA